MAKKTSYLPKNNFFVAFKGVNCTFLKVYGGRSSGLQNKFMLLWAKNPRNRSRCMCSYEMKKSGFFDNLSALQKSLLCDHPLTVHMDFPKKFGCMKQNSLHKWKMGGEAPGMTQKQNDLFSTDF